MEATISIDSDLREISRVKTELASNLEACGVIRASIQDAQLIAEEVIANIIGHGHAGAPGHRITLRALLCGDLLTLEFEDDAPGFDPRSHVPAELFTENAPAIPMGGVGIHLIQQISDEMDYRRVNDRNHLTIRQRVDRNG